MSCTGKPLPQASRPLQQSDAYNWKHNLFDKIDDQFIFYINGEVEYQTDEVALGIFLIDRVAVIIKCNSKAYVESWKEDLGNSDIEINGEQADVAILSSRDWDLKTLNELIDPAQPAINLTIWMRERGLLDDPN